MSQQTNEEIANKICESGVLNKRATSTLIWAELDHKDRFIHALKVDLDTKDEQIARLTAERDSLQKAFNYRIDEVYRLTSEKDEAYRQRNFLVASLARIYPSGIKRTNIPGWSDDWHGCCFIDLPTGQISYHYHDSHAHLFKDLPPYEKEWDGHDKDKVHQRLLDLTPISHHIEIMEAEKKVVEKAMVWNNCLHATPYNDEIYHRAEDDLVESLSNLQSKQNKGE